MPLITGTITGTINGTTNGTIRGTAIVPLGVPLVVLGSGTTNGAINCNWRNH